MEPILAPDAQTAPGAAPLPENSNFRRQLGTRALVGQYERAIELADQAGDTHAAMELATKLREIMSGSAAAQPSGVPIGEQGFKAAASEVANASGPFAQVMAGVGTAPMLAWEGVKGLVGAGDKREAEQIRAVRDASGWTRGGNMAGNAAMAALPFYPTRGIAGGFKAVGAEAPKWLTGRLGQALDTGVTAGLMNAATEPGDARERLYAAATAAPLAAAGPLMMGSGQILRRNTTNEGRRIAVGEGLRTELGDERADQLAAALRQRDPSSAALGVHPSAAMVTDDATLRAMEAGSRVKNGDLWTPFDRNNAQARWNALLDRRGTDEALAALREARTAQTAPMREGALGVASSVFPSGKVAASSVAPLQDKLLAPLTSKLDELASGPMRPNSSVQTIVGYVQRELEKGVTPQQLSVIRDELTSGIKAAPTSDLAKAAAAARAQRMQIVNAIDETLNTMSGGNWSRYLKAYQAASPEITSKEALGRMVDALKRGQPEGAVPTAMGESAAWKTVGNLRDTVGAKMFGGKTFDRLTPEDRALVDALVSNLKKQSDVMSARGILGSPTAQFIANGNRADAVTRRVVVNGMEQMVPGGGLLASRAFDKQGRAAEQELARLLQNPDDLALALEKARLAQLLMQGSQRASTIGAAAEAHR